jgi:hypothetical protein
MSSGLPRGPALNSDSIGGLALQHQPEKAPGALLPGLIEGFLAARHLYGP